MSTAPNIQNVVAALIIEELKNGRVCVCVCVRVYLKSLSHGTLLASLTLPEEFDGFHTRRL